MPASPESVLAPCHRLPMKGSIMNLFLRPLPGPSERRAAGPPRARPRPEKGEAGSPGQPRRPRPPLCGALRRRCRCRRLDVRAVSGGRRARAEQGARGAPARPPGPSCCMRGPGAGGAPRSWAAAPEVGPGAPPPPTPAIPPFIGSEVRVCY